MRIITIFCIFFLFVQCSTKKVLIGEDFSVSLDKTACFGSCPVYNLTINDKGVAIFDGKRFTDKIGIHSLKVSKPELDAIAQAFSTADLEQYQDVYENNIPDLPLITIGYINNGKSKSVAGKIERPQAIKDLQGMLEDIAHKEGWVSIDTVSNTTAKDADDILAEEEEVEEKEPIIENELIIAFKKGTIISRWMKQYRDFEMYVKKPLTDDRRVWLVHYDTKIIAPDALLAKIQADPGIESVEFNKPESAKKEN